MIDGLIQAMPPSVVGLEITEHERFDDDMIGAQGKILADKLGNRPDHEVCIAVGCARRRAVPRVADVGQLGRRPGEARA